MNVLWHSPVVSVKESEIVFVVAGHQRRFVQYRVGDDGEENEGWMRRMGKIEEVEPILKQRRTLSIKEANDECNSSTVTSGHKLENLESIGVHDRIPY